jgi:hypothetical protein
MPFSTYTRLQLIDLKFLVLDMLCVRILPLHQCKKLLLIEIVAACKSFPIAHMQSLSSMQGQSFAFKCPDLTYEFMSTIWDDTEDLLEQVVRKGRRRRHTFIYHNDVWVENSIIFYIAKEPKFYFFVDVFELIQINNICFCFNFGFSFFWLDIKPFQVCY